MQSGATAAADVDGVGGQLRQELVALGAPHQPNPRDRLRLRRRVPFHSRLPPPSPDSTLLLLGAPGNHEHRRGINSAQETGS